MSAFGSGTPCYGIPKTQPGTRKKGAGTIQFLAENGQHFRPMRRTEWCETDAKLILGYLEICSIGQCGLNQCSSFIPDAFVVRSHKIHEITLGLVCDHLNNVGKVLSLRGEFYDSFSYDLFDRNFLGHGRAFLFKGNHAVKCFPQAFCQFALCDLEPAHGWPGLFGTEKGLGSVLSREPLKFCTRLVQLNFERDSLGIGNLARWIIRDNLIVDQGIQSVLLAQIFKEILLPPSPEHPERNLCRRKVTPGGQDGCLVAILSKAHDLAQTQFASQKTNTLIRKRIGYLLAVDDGFVEIEAGSGYATEPPLAIRRRK
jgi:hypothetical protein